MGFPFLLACHCCFHSFILFAKEQVHGMTTRQKNCAYSCQLLKPKNMPTTTTTAELLQRLSVTYKNRSYYSVNRSFKFDQRTEINNVNNVYSLSVIYFIVMLFVANKLSLSWVPNYQSIPVDRHWLQDGSIHSGVASVSELLQDVHGAKLDSRS